MSIIWMRILFLKNSRLFWYFFLLEIQRSIFREIDIRFPRTVPLMGNTISRLADTFYPENIGRKDR